MAMRWGERFKVLLEGYKAGKKIERRLPDNSSNKDTDEKTKKN